MGGDRQAGPTTAPTSPPERSRLLCQWALEEGFDRAGVASLEVSQYGETFRRWLDRGDHAGMEWLARRVDERLDPSTRLEGSRSALCVALHYPDRDGTETDLWEGVARYAQGDDYHDVTMARLRRLGDRIERAFPGCRTRSYVDHGPLLERELAQRAGLGRIGKNTMLLHRSGSYFLLGEVLCTLELEPSTPLPDLCGNCTRCLEACPTGALPEPFRLDARRCISYWTIESRGSFSPGVGERNGRWSFGCDICQEVCPWNGPRNPRRLDVDHPELERPEHRRGLDLVGLISLSRERYTELFRHSPLKRSKLEGLQRNAVHALANRARDLWDEERRDGEAGGDRAEVRRREVVAELDRLLRSLAVAVDNPAPGVRRAVVDSLLGTLQPMVSDGLPSRSSGDLRKALRERVEVEEDAGLVRLLETCVSELADCPAIGAQGRPIGPPNG